MKLGVCCSLERIEKTLKIGYDYVELNMQVIMKLNLEELENLLSFVKNNNINVYAFNSFIPGDLKVTGPSINFELLVTYIDLALKRASLLGGKIVVFGSGDARRVIEGFDFDEAKEQLVQFLRLCSSIAERYNITIAVEHLNIKECNILTSIKESLELVEMVNLPNIRLLIDFYHKELEKESNAIIKECLNYLVHVHIASSPSRSFPKNDNENDYKDFFDHLKAIGYDGGVSIEALSNNFEDDLPISYEFLRHYVK